MDKHDFGYFGKGTEGYAQYQTAFHRNFPQQPSASTPQPCNQTNATTKTTGLDLLCALSFLATAVCLCIAGNFDNPPPTQKIALGAMFGFGALTLLLWKLSKKRRC